MRWPAISLVLAAGVLGSALVGRPATGASPVAAVPFTTAQAEEGAVIYGERCALCHGARLEGAYETPALTGKFVANWARRPVGDLAAYLGRAMPQSAPGTLTPADTTRLVAYLLAANGYPAGARALPDDAAALAMAMPPPPPPR